MAAFHAMNYIGAWELRYRDATFPARSILAGWDGVQPCVYKVASINKGGLEYTEDRNSITVTGSGARFAHSYALRNICLCSSIQFARVSRDSVLNAAMRDAPTGDQIQVVEVLQNGYMKGNPQDVLHIMNDRYVVFQPILVNSLFFIHSRARLPYSDASDKIVSEEICARLGVSLAKVPHVTPSLAQISSLTILSEASLYGRRILLCMKNSEFTRIG
ncbi:hypothetical protein M0R45_013845 [Rubus argutus]|uniref:Uncharacterized protein n=1 Tax=Rubus argutus TaxID=59490 RepID=A0AAW1XKI0_RUBAR